MDSFRPAESENLGISHNTPGYSVQNRRKHVLKPIRLSLHFLSVNWQSGKVTISQNGRMNPFSGKHNACDFVFAEMKQLFILSFFFFFNRLKKNILNFFFFTLAKNQILFLWTSMPEFFTN